MGSPKGLSWGNCLISSLMVWKMERAHTWQIYRSHQLELQTMKNRIRVQSDLDKLEKCSKIN